MSESTAIALRRSDDELTSLADRLCKSTLLPKSMQGKMADVLVTIMAGQEMGLAPMASLRAFHVIEGKPVLSSDGMVALVISSGKAAYFECISESDTSVTYETLRVGSKSPQRCTWTMEMAKAAALHQKDNWRLYKRQMLGSRCRSELARRVYPDVLMGCYSPEESSDWVAPERQAPQQQHADVIDAEFSEETTTNPREIAQIDTAVSLAELKALTGALSKLKLTPAQKDVVNERYRARLVWMKSQSATTVVATPTSPQSSSDGSGVSEPTTSAGFATQSDASTGDAA